MIEEAWRIADRLGRAKTYDAEYLALARLLKCRLLTADAKLKVAGSRLVDVLGPTELQSLGHTEHARGCGPARNA